MAVGTHQDWSDLIPELINLIAKKLPNVLDFIRFRATCKSWRSSAPLSDSPTQCPWILGHNVYNNDSPPTIKLQFYSVCSRQTFTVPVGGIQRFHGPSCHYLPITKCNERRISFFNPLTKDKYFPPLIPGPNRLYCLRVVWTGTNSIRDRNIIVTGFSPYKTEQGLLAFLYNPQNGQWTRGEGSLLSVCYCRGMLFATDQGSKTDIFDISSTKLLYTVPPPLDDKPYVDTTKGDGITWLSESHLFESSGEVFRVSSFRTEAKQIVTQYVFHIHKLDFYRAGRQPRWVRVNDMGNQTIFLGQETGFSIPAVPSAGFKENCIYFIDRYNGKPYVHDIAACTVEMLPCPLERCTWFIPSLC